ncbi:hypothetical protein GCM10010231_37360 [Streptomyces sindenensis]|nr:hypothetical protein GCM10010231_37360 [Streptomyces sindenensis]
MAAGHAMGPFRATPDAHQERGIPHPPRPRTNIAPAGGGELLLTLLGKRNARGLTAPTAASGRPSPPTGRREAGKRGSDGNRLAARLVGPVWSGLPACRAGGTRVESDADDQPPSDDDPVAPHRPRGA